MNPRFARISPMRSPHWRYERVVELLRGRPQPGRVTRDDDHPIRRAHRMLTELAAAGCNQARIDEIRREHADFWHAHAIYYSADSLIRHMLEAHLLLPDMSFEEIAVQFATTPETIQYFADVYYDVRDRLERRMWIHKIIRGGFDPFRTMAEGDVGNEARGYVLRTLAYGGGRHVLATAINGLDTDRKPETSADILSWFEDALNQMVRLAAVTAGITVPVDSKNAMQLIKIAMKKPSAGAGREARNADLDARLFDHLSKIQVPAHPAKSVGPPSSFEACSRQTREEPAGNHL